MVLGTRNIDTCLITTLYAPHAKKGVLSHITGFSEFQIYRPKFIIGTMIEEFLDKQNLVASLAGGRNFNIDPITEELDARGIPIIGRDLNTLAQRVALLYCDTGNVEIYHC